MSSSSDSSAPLQEASPAISAASSPAKEEPTPLSAHSSSSSATADSKPTAKQEKNPKKRLPASKIVTVDGDATTSGIPYFEPASDSSSIEEARPTQPKLAAVEEIPTATHSKKSGKKAKKESKEAKSASKPKVRVFMSKSSSLRRNYAWIF